MTVSAAADGDEYIINGTKLFVHDAHIADTLLCVTRTTDAGKPEEGITLFLVDARDHGIGYEILETTAGDKQSEGLSCDTEVALAKAWTRDSHDRACWRERWEEMEKGKTGCRISASLFRSCCIVEPT